MKKCVWTLNIDNYAPELTALSFPLLNRYAQKIGADFRVISERQYQNMPPVYEKLQLHTLGKDYDWNLFFDADALVHPDFFDPTEHLHKDTVMHNGHDLAGNRWRYDDYFRRDGRHIGSCNWFAVASDWCLDLWHPLEDLTLAEAVSNIFPTVNELNTVITREHLIDDYVLSRNIARFGLKFKGLEDLCRDMGRQNGFLWHIYTETIENKAQQMRTVLSAWKVGGKGVYKQPNPSIEGWMSDAELQWLYDQACKMWDIVEIGSWKGRSTHALLSGCGGMVTAVDHFRGSPSERGTTHSEAATDDIRGQFMKNVGHFGNLFMPTISDSLEAAKYHETVDMVFIDGDHSFEGCLADIQAWRPKARKLLCGHDRDQEGVPKALAAAGISWQPGPGSIWVHKVKA